MSTTHLFLAAKGGQGTTVTAATAALIHARRGARTLLIDAADHHDCHATLGLPEPTDPTDPTEITRGLDLMCAGALIGGDEHRDYDVVIVDAGQRTDLVTPAQTVSLVTRNCYLALRRALTLPVEINSVVVIEEPERALRSDDVAAVLGVPVAASLRLDPAVARVVDAGLLAARLPRSLEHLADAPTTTAI